MKKILTLLLAMAWLPLWGQVVVPDSTGRAIPADSIAVDEDDDDDEPNVIGARPQPRQTKGEANVLGSPIYYDLDGNAIGGNDRRATASPRHHRQRPSGTYRMPEHHYLNNVGRNFNSYFFEVETLIGINDLALGANFTYLPERWGLYGSALGGNRRNYFSLGPALRLSGRDSRLDFQLYGGAVFGHRAGGEVGLRLAGPSRNSEFCWASASMGLMFLGNDTYLTIGLSLEVAAISALTLFFW